MRISRDQYEFFMEQGIPYEGEVDGLGYAYTGISISQYPINRSRTLTMFRLETVNVCVVSKPQFPVVPSAAMEAKVEADLNWFQTELSIKMGELNKALHEQSLAHTHALEAAEKESAAARAVREAEAAANADASAKAEAAAKAKAAAEKAEKEKTAAAAKKEEADRAANDIEKVLDKIINYLAKYSAPISAQNKLESTLGDLRSVPNDRIQKALDYVVHQYEGTKYGQETNSLRTDTTKAALEFMDCTELVARYLQIACGLPSVPRFYSEDLALAADKNEIFRGYLQYIENSADTTFREIHPGYIFVWRRKEKVNKAGEITRKADGHAGIVVSYDPAKDVVRVLESIGASGSAGASIINDEKKDQVRCSEYPRTGKSLAGHEGWKGYSASIINTQK